MKGKGKGKDNVWSIDNEMAKTEKERDKPRSRRRKRGGKRMRNVTKKRICDRVMISSAMLMEVETVLQTQVTFYIYEYLMCQQFFSYCIICNGSDELTWIEQNCSKLGLWCS